MKKQSTTPSEKKFNADYIDEYVKQRLNSDPTAFRQEYMNDPIPDRPPFSEVADDPVRRNHYYPSRRVYMNYYDLPELP